MIGPYASTLGRTGAVQLTREAGGSQVNFGQALVGTTPVLILPRNDSRISLSLVNTGTATIYLGRDASVSSTNGFPILASGYFNTSNLSQIYAVSGSGTITVGWWEDIP